MERMDVKKHDMEGRNGEVKEWGLGEEPGTSV